MTTKETHNEQPAEHSEATGDSRNPWPWIGGILLLLGIVVTAGFYWNATLTIKGVQFEGNHFVSADELKKVEVPTGISPDSVDFMDIISRFEKIPYVRRADVSMEANGMLNVQITERQPLALLADGDKKIYVDENGIRLSQVLGKTVDVPILYGFSATPMSDTLKSDAFNYTADFLTNVRNSTVSDATISEIAWTKNEGVVALTNQNGVKLIFGKGDFKRRLRNWEAFYGKIIKQKGIEKMRSVDLRFKGQIVTREK